MTIGNSLTYQWRKGNVNLTDGANISGSTTTTLTLSNITASDAGSYRLIITNLIGNCPTVRSNFATLTVDPVSVGGTLSADATVCSGSNNGTLSLSGQTGTVTRWEYSTNGGSTWTNIANTNTSQGYSNLTTTTQYRVLVQNKTCPGAYSSIVTVTISPTPTGTASPSSQNVCSGSAISTITFAGNLSNMAYSWTRDQTATVTGIASSGSGNISGTLVNSANTQKRVIFTITPTDTIATGICTGTIFYDTVYVNPMPTVSTSPSALQSVCTSGAQSLGNFSSITIKNPNNVSGSTWSWTRDNTTNITGLASSGSGSSFNGIISGVALTNTTSTIQQTIFTIKAISPAGCFSTTYDTIQVNPEITNNEIFVKTVCVVNDDSVNIIVKDVSTLGGGSGTYTYQWYERHPQGNDYSTILAPRGTKQTLNYSTGSENYFFKRDVYSGGCMLTSNEAHVNTIGNGSITNADDDSITPHTPTSYCTGGIGVRIGTNNSILSDTSYGFQITYVLYKDNVPVDTVFGTGGAVDFGYFTQVGIYKVKVVIGVPGQTPCSPIPLQGSLKITIDTLATTANAGPNQSLCAVTTTTMSGNNAGTSTGTWSLVSGSGNIASSHSATTGITGLSSGANVFRWTMVNGACSNYSDVTVTVNSPNVAATSLSGTSPICSGSSITLTQNGGTLGTGATWKWYSDASYTTLVGTSNSSDASLAVSPTATTTYYLRAEGAASPCTINTPSGSITIVVNKPNVAPSLLNGTSPICNGSSTILTQIGGSLGTGATWKWYSNAGYTTLVGTTSSSNASLTVTPAVTTTYYLRAEGASSPCTSNTPAGSLTIAVNPRPTSVITGSGIQCKGAVTPITVSFTGTAPWSITYSDGANSTTINNINTNPYTFTVAPLVTAAYNLIAMSDLNCVSQAADRSGTVTVTVPNGAVGVWTGIVDSDWFNCRNWAIGSVPTLVDSANIPFTVTSPRIDQTSIYATGHAQCDKLTVANNTLYFSKSSDSLFSTGNVVIQSGGKIDMSAGGRLEVQGDWKNEAPAGFISGTGTVVFSGSNTQTISSINTPEIFYNLQLNKTLSTQQLNLQSSVRINHDIVLSKGIITTENNLLTWDKGGGGSMSSPNAPWVAGQTSHSNSYICTCTSTGDPLSFSKPFNGSFGFKILSVAGNNDVYFPVGADLVSANRMSLNMNNLVTRDFAVIVTKGDIGNTTDPRVNRIWHVNASDTTGVRATMKLFFTKRTDFINWPNPEDEIEPPFPFSSVRLIQKYYDESYFINVSSSTDMQTGWAGAALGTEVYALYTKGVSQAFDLSKNGITEFNEFSIIDGADIVLPVTITNIKAWQDGAAIKVGWTSQQEINIDHYEVEKALDAQHFKYLGDVVAKNNELTSNYLFTDYSPATGNNYYRIKVVDKNGALGYTSIVVVNVGNGIAKIYVYPNPALQHIFNLQMNNVNAGNYKLIVYDAAGRVVISKDVEHFGGSSTQQIVFPAGTASGAYRVVLLSNKKAIYSTPLIVAH